MRPVCHRESAVWAVCMERATSACVYVPSAVIWACEVAERQWRACACVGPGHARTPHTSPHAGCLPGQPRPLLAQRMVTACLLVDLPGGDAWGDCVGAMLRSGAAEGASWSGVVRAEGGFIRS